jgi:glycosyltransferase involved in cell wall biosynthesis
MSDIHQQSLRIGFDAKRAFNNNTGLGNYSRFVIKGFIQHHPQHQYYLFTPKITHAFINEVKHYPNVHVIMPDTVWGKVFKSFWRSYSITNLSKQLKLDVFHGLSNELPVNIKNFQGNKLVTIHDLIFLRYPKYYSFIDRWIYKRKFKQAIQNADEVIAASQQTASDIIQFFQTDSSKISVVYQNCDEQFSQVYALEAKEQLKKKYHLADAYMVCIGTIEQRKNQLLVLKAFHQANLPQVELVFVGRKTKYAEELSTYIYNNELQTRVKFIEGAPFSDFPLFYQAAMFAVYASEFEGFGIPVLEALRSNTYTIVANTSSLPEVGGDAVTYFEYNDANDLAQKMKNAALPYLNKEIMRQQIQKFDTSFLINQLNQLYISKSI